MKRAVALALLAAVATVGSSFAGSEAEARGWRAHRAHFGFYHRPFVRVVPVYPVYTGYCRWFRTPYGLVKRCYY